MPTDEMVEKVARAICASDFDGDETVFDTMSLAQQDNFRINARAAIAALTGAEAQPVSLLGTLSADQFAAAMAYQGPENMMPADAPTTPTPPAPSRADVIEALQEAREMVQAWAAYASPYFREKHDLDGDLAKLDAAIRKLKG